jgi:hypothetical protein
MADHIPVSGIAISPGWIAAAALAAWGWFTRLAIGRHFKALDKLADKVDGMGTTVTKIDTRLAKIEGRFEQQDAER